MAEAAVWVVAATVVAALPAPGTEADAAQPRSLESLPDLQPGEWWRLHVRDNRGGESIQGTIVVTEASRDGVAFGVGFDSLHPMLLNYHVMPPGAAGPDLSYEVHGHTFQPFDFPLRPGHRWQTQFGAVPLTAVVTDATSSTASIDYLGPGGGLYAQSVYDASLGWFSQLRFGRQEMGMRADGYWVEANVIEHGYSYGCESVQPRGMQLLDLVHGPADPSPLRVLPFTVPPASTHIAVSMSVGSPAGSAGSSARQQLLGPDGTVYQVNAEPGEEYQHQFIVKTDPAGTWLATMERVAGGFSSTTASMFEAERVAPFGEPDPGTDSCAPLHASGTAVGPPREPSDIGEKAWRLVALAGVAIARFWRRIGWAALGLFSRIDKGPAAEQPVRRRILDAIGQANGLTTQEIRRLLGIGWGTTVHHLAVLERHGWAVRSHSRRRVYWSLPGRPVAPREHGTAARLLEAIRHEPGLGPVQLGHALGIRHSTAIYHVRRLEREGKVVVESDGRRRRYYPAPALDGAGAAGERAAA